MDYQELAEVLYWARQNANLVLPAKMCKEVVIDQDTVCDISIPHTADRTLVEQNGEEFYDFTGTFDATWWDTHVKWNPTAAIRLQWYGPTLEAPMATAPETLTLITKEQSATMAGVYIDSYYPTDNDASAKPTWAQILQWNTTRNAG